MSNTNEEALSLDSSMTAGAISLALTYINKTCFGGNRNAMVMKDDVEKGVKSDYGAEAGREMNARILVVSVSEDMASQYIPVMNSIFAAQRKVFDYTKSQLFSKQLYSIHFPLLSLFLICVKGLGSGPC